ncbi:phosphonate transport system substrate-binding protein [Alkalihalobacillus xiaoxiensis]|uniref:Phosphonate transport system substrate-binding protein n=1 Tax=Shouchella xiaoxiensis TaxID=766895 RepID=A0ABS2SW06_9BACI|nr:PhnD/SsuA/transferrin family substrate-binding protein [Shouchella xiaoxiensis]MBM7839692.1 phosphonate transport system substrate-binding protein [Shouchella xiaoxiensis]
MKKIFLFAGLSFLLVGCGQGTNEATAEGDRAGSETNERENWPETLRFADTGLEGLEELQREFGPFKDALEEVLDIEIEFFAVNDRIIGATALEYDQVDVLLAGPSEYAQIKSVVPGAEPIVGIERADYHAAIIVHEDSEYQTLEDIKGTTVAMKDAGSTSGHIGPSQILIEAGFDLDRDVSIQLLDGARIEAFKNHDVEVLATGIKDYQQMVEEDGEGKYRLLAEGEPLPNDLFVASPALDDGFVEELTAAILENQDVILSSILETGENDKYLEGQFVDAEDADYDSMREAYRVLGMELD